MTIGGDGREGVDATQGDHHPGDGKVAGRPFRSRVADRPEEVDLVDVPLAIKLFDQQVRSNWPGENAANDSS